VAVRFVPRIVPRSGFFCQETWSEWQDLNLRPPRPERGALPDCATLRHAVALIQSALWGCKRQPFALIYECDEFGRSPTGDARVAG
jgi:hypothetical protein